MRYFDLHCDTMTECALKNIPLRRNLLHVDLDTVQGWERYVQCYAVWLPDELRGEPAWQRFLQVAERFSREVGKNAGCLRQLRAPGDLDSLEGSGRHGAILTVESSAVLGGRLERIQDLRRLGVRMCTLTWNGETELGRGVLAPGNTGLTDLGRQAVPLMEEAGILIDLSHASPELFWDVAEMAHKPLVASHSNAKGVSAHPRNLEKEPVRGHPQFWRAGGAQFLQSIFKRPAGKSLYGGCPAPRRLFSFPGRGGHPGNGRRLGRRRPARGHARAFRHPSPV